MTKRGRISFLQSTSAAVAGRGRAAFGGWEMSCVPFFALLACLLASGVAHGKDVQWVRPRIGQRGTTVEVVIQGIQLAEPRELIFYKPGVRAVKVEPLPKMQYPHGLVHGERVEEQVKAVLEIAPDCEPGEHPFRLRTAHGLSVLSTFHVSPFPVVAEVTTPNDSIETAQAVEPNVTVLGTVDTDVFKVPAQPGSRLSVEVDSARLADIHYGDAEFDLAVRVLDETGRVLAANDDSALHVQDPLVSLKIPDDLPGGHAYVEVRQSIHRPSNIPYCVHIGTFRRPLAAYPAGGKAGEPVAVTFRGDPLGEFAETVNVPAATGSFSQTFSQTFSWFGDAPSPLALRSSPYDNLLEDPAAPENRVPSLPIAVNGTIEKPGDTDAFRLAVKKGDRYRVRVFASALGHPLDPAIRIRPIGADGKPGAVEVEADDAVGGDRDLFGTFIRSGGGFKDVLDPSVIWEAKADGDYLLEIFDTAGGGGSAAVYRIEIDTPPQQMHVVLDSPSHNDWPEVPRHNGLAVPQGGRWTVSVDLKRGQGTTYSGPFDIVAEGLPEGVRLVARRVPGLVPRWPVELVADPGVRPGAAIITLGAKAADPAVSLRGSCQQAVPFVNHPGGGAWRILRTDRFAMAVIDPAPIAIDLVQPTAALVRGGELFIPVKLTRRAGYDEPVTYRADFAAPGVGLPPEEVIPSGATEAVLRITAERNAPLGKGPLYVAATTRDSGKVGYGDVRVSSQLIEIEVAEPFVELASEPTSVRRGGRATVSFKVTPKSPFEGEAEVKLLGLPKGVSLAGPSPKITKDAKQIDFTVEATDEALLGPVSGLECELILKVSDQEIRQRAGKGTLRIDPRL
jgi:hypothetical protein